MINNGMNGALGIQEVYRKHNMPRLPVDEFVIRPGPLMRASDPFASFPTPSK